MKFIKEYYICDRCKKEVSKKDRFLTYYGPYCYDLCNECKTMYDEFRKKESILEQNADNLEKKYKFGKYLPRNERLDDNINIML